MRTPYLYEIAIRGKDGEWRVVATRREVSVGDARSTARTLVIRWLVDHIGQVPSSRVFVLGRPSATEPRGLTAHVRIRVYDRRSSTEAPLAVAYVGHYDENTFWPRRLREWLARERSLQVMTRPRRNGDSEAA